MKNKDHAHFPVVLLLIGAIALSIVFSPSVAAKAAAANNVSCQVTYTIATQWPSSSQAPGGFEAFLTLKNTGTTTINGWTVHFTFPNGQVIFNYFGANFTQSGADVTITNLSFNGTIQPGSTPVYNPGFLASWWGINNPPASITLNDTPCTVLRNVPV